MQSMSGNNKEPDLRSCLPAPCRRAGPRLVRAVRRDWEGPGRQADYTFKCSFITIVIITLIIIIIIIIIIVSLSLDLNTETK